MSRDRKGKVETPDEQTGGQQPCPSACKPSSAAEWDLSRRGPPSVVHASRPGCPGQRQPLSVWGILSFAAADIGAGHFSVVGAALCIAGRSAARRLPPPTTGQCHPHPAVTVNTSPEGQEVQGGPWLRLRVYCRTLHSFLGAGVASAFRVHLHFPLGLHLLLPRRFKGPTPRNMPSSRILFPWQTLGDREGGVGYQCRAVSTPAERQSSTDRNRGVKCRTQVLSSSCSVTFQTASSRATLNFFLFCFTSFPFLSFLFYFQERERAHERGGGRAGGEEENLRPTPQPAGAWRAARPHDPGVTIWVGI